MAAFEGKEAVDQDRRSVRFERLNHVGRSHRNVMVAEDAKALWRLEPGEHFGGASGGVKGHTQITRAPGNEITGEKDQIGVEGVDLADHLFEKPGLGVLLEMDVGHLDDTEVDEGVGQVADGESALGDFEFVAPVRAGIEGKASPGSRGAEQEASACDAAGVFPGGGAPIVSKSFGHKP